MSKAIAPKSRRVEVCSLSYLLSPVPLFIGSKANFINGVRDIFVRHGLGAHSIVQRNWQAACRRLPFDLLKGRISFWRGVQISIRNSKVEVEKYCQTFRHRHNEVLRDRGFSQGVSSGLGNLTFVFARKTARSSSPTKAQFANHHSHTPPSPNRMEI